MDRDGTDWFEPLYAAADGDAERVPWARSAPSPLLLSWLDQPGLDVAGSDALVVGCGLGDDAIELARRGCNVVAFDISPTAVGWARRRAASEELDGRCEFRVADLLDLPPELVAAAGLVVEVRTVQSLPERLRQDALRAVAATVAPGGVLVHIGLVATSPRAAAVSDGPPWPLAPDELVAYEDAGLQRLGLAHPPDAQGEAMEVVLTLRRPLDGPSDSGGPPSAGAA